MIRRLRTFAKDERGNIAILGAVCMVVVTGLAAFGVDLGTIFADKRRVQSAADLAAIVAASDLTHASSAAAATVSKNNYPPDSLVAVETGVYKADASLAPQQRFTPGAVPANAVRVTMQARTPLFFGKVLTGSDHFNVKATSVASTTQLATFAIGSGLVSLNNGLLNALLGKLLGTSLSLSVMDYQSLINANVNLLDFLSALATRVSLTGVSYDTLLQSTLKVGDVLGALQATVGGPASSVLANVAASANGVTAQIGLKDLVDLGPYRDMPVGTEPRVGVDVGAFDLLSAIAQLANGTNQAAVDVNLGIPGIASVTLQVTLGERPVGSSWVAVGSEGTSVHTAQTRVYAKVQLLGTGPVSVVKLPIYVEVASGTATLNSMSCGYPNIDTSTVQLGVSPGVVDAWIGDVSSSEMTNFSTKPSAGPVTIVDLGLIKVSALAHATIANPTPQKVNFSYSDILSNKRKTVNTSSFLTSLLSSLLGDLRLTITLGPLAIPIPGLGPLIVGIISAVTTPVDALLSLVLQALGVGLGQADVWVPGIRCDGAVLVG